MATDELGNTLTYAYDLAGRLEAVTDSARGTTTNALTQTTSRALTSYGLPDDTTYPGGATTSQTFRGLTNLDASGSFPLTEVDEESRTRTFTYDADSVLTSASDLGGNAWTYGHTRVLGGDVRWDASSGRVWVGVDGARAPVTRYAGEDETRDGPRPDVLDVWVDRLETVTSPEGDATSWTFGPGGEVAQVDYPFGGSMSRTFGPDLRIATESRAFGTTLTFTRDAAGRVTQRDGSDGSQRTYTYGPQDRVETYTDATGSTTQRFDAAGRLDGIDYPTAAVFEQDWDVMDRVERVRVTDHAATPTTRESTFAYDAGGNLETVTDPFGRVTTTTYDALDRPVLVVRPNGVETATVYDDRGWVESMTHTDASGAVLASVTYVRSDSGEPTRVTREDGSYVEVAYDAALRVERESYYDLAGTVVEQIAYTYDPDGNRTSRTTSAGTETYVYASGARLDFIERGGATVADFTYDAGARVTRIERGGRDLHLTYDADDHVVAIDEAVSGDRAEIDFDAMERRTGRRTLVGAALVAAVAFLTAPSHVQALESPHLVTDASTGAATTGYVYDGEHALARYDASTGDEVYYLRDAMGSVIGLVDGAGTGASTIHYDGFGNVRSSSGPLAALPAHGGPRFQGMWLDPEGLYYVRARTYDAETGRFTSRDPADIRRLVPEYWAPYGFAYQNAYVFRDPSGATSLVEQMATVAIVFIQAAVRTARLLASAASVACAINAVLLTVGDLPSFGPCGNQRFYQTLSLEDAARAKVLSDQLNQFLIPALVAGTLKMVPANTVYSEWPVITRLALCTKRPLRTSSWGSDAFEASHSMP